MQTCLQEHLAHHEYLMLLVAEYVTNSILSLEHISIPTPSFVCIDLYEGILDATKLENTKRRRKVNQALRYYSRTFLLPSSTFESLAPQLWSEYELTDTLRKAKKHADLGSVAWIFLQYYLSRLCGR
jgi:hypothetical protein